MSGEDEETQRKQEYLKTNILDAAYDPQTFLDFMTAKKGAAAP